MSTFALLATLLAAAPASAQTFTLHGSWLLEAQPGTFTENGVGAPSVVWDPDQRAYVMFFETPVDTGDAYCNWGHWSIGVAWSDDGLSWQTWPTAVIPYGAQSWSKCVAAHPEAMIEPDGTYKVWFKAQQGRKACQGLASPHPWGCKRITGVGLAVGDLRLRTPDELRTVLEDRQDEIMVEAEPVAQDLYDATVAFNESLTKKNENERIWQDILARSDGLEADADLAETDGADLEEQLGFWLAAHDNLNELDDAEGFALSLQSLLPGFIADLQAEPQDPQLDDLIADLQDWLTAIELYLDLYIPLGDEYDGIQDQIDEIDLGLYQQGVDLVVEPNLALEVSGFGYPTVAKVGATYHMLLAQVPDIVHATSSDGASFTLDAAPVMSPGVALWAPDELYNPSAVCFDGADSSQPYEDFFGGREMSGFTVVAGGWGKATSSDWTSWLVNATPYFQFAGTAAWRHWDVTRVGNDYLAWYSEKDAAGLNRIGLAMSDSAWSWEDISPGICTP